MKNTPINLFISYDIDKLCIYQIPGSQVQPTPTEGVIPPLVQPVVTTGWYDQYVPTEAPTTLSTAVIGRKVWRDERREKRLKKKRRRIRRQRRLLQQEKEKKEQEAHAHLHQEEPIQEKRKGWQLLKAYDKRRQEAGLLEADISVCSLGKQQPQQQRIGTGDRSSEDHIISSLQSSTNNYGQSYSDQKTDYDDPRSKRIGRYIIKFPPIFDRFTLSQRQRNDIKSCETQHQQQQQQQQRQQQQQQIRRHEETLFEGRDPCYSVTGGSERPARKHVTFKIMSYPTAEP